MCFFSIRLNIVEKNRKNDCYAGESKFCTYFNDTKNVSAKLREGWELVRADEYPDFEAPVVDSGKYEGVFGVGGLVLARMPIETIAERTAYFNERKADQMNAVDQDMMRENAHSTMTISKADRQSRVTFGGPKK